MISETINVKVDNQLSKKPTERMDAKKDHHANKKNANIGLRVPGSNWEKYKSLISEASATDQTSNNVPVKRKKRNRKPAHKLNDTLHHLESEQKQIINKAANEQKEQKQIINKTENVKKMGKKPEPGADLTKIIAMDCEMVGIGDGQESMIARVSIVNRNGVCVYDKYVKPTEEVQDYRTAVSGIRPHHLQTGHEFKTVQKEVAEILRGRILVGHALHNDLAVLFLSHPKRFQRDTSRYKIFRKVTKGNTPSLKKLASELLGVEIQTGEHNSIEDARAAMQLYQLFRKKWESDIRAKR